VCVCMYVCVCVCCVCMYAYVRACACVCVRKRYDKMISTIHHVTRAAFMCPCRQEKKERRTAKKLEGNEDDIDALLARCAVLCTVVIAPHTLLSTCQEASRGQMHMPCILPLKL